VVADVTFVPMVLGSSLSAKSASSLDFSEKFALQEATRKVSNQAWNLSPG
jgi:hypothetical protein